MYTYVYIYMYIYIHIYIYIYIQIYIQSELVSYTVGEDAIFFESRRCVVILYMIS